MEPSWDHGGPVQALTGDRDSVNPPIVLATDFGLSDPFVGVMKGVILSINPEATVVDLTHQVQAQNVSHGAFLLGTSHGFFPAGTIYTVVVDPGVGTTRAALLLVTPRGKYLAPDNGVLSCVVADYLEQPPGQRQRIAVPPAIEAYNLNNPEYWLHPVSNTFHGRDVFAPAAAHLSLGVPAEDLGGPARDLVWLPQPQPTFEGGRILGEVIHVDRFGNLVTNIPEDALPGDGKLEVEIKAGSIIGLSRTYNQPGPSSTDHNGPDDQPGRTPAAGPVALMGSQGFLEIAVPNGNAAALLEASVGEPVRVVLRRYPGVP